MDSYIIRVYRRAENDPRSIVGTVNNVATEESRAFKTVEELWAILNEVATDPNTGAVTWSAGDKGKKSHGGPQRGEKGSPRKEGR